MAIFCELKIADFQGLCVASLRSNAHSKNLNKKKFPFGSVQILPETWTLSYSTDSYENLSKATFFCV